MKYSKNSITKNVIFPSKEGEKKLIEVAKKLEGKVPVSEKVDEARKIFKNVNKLSINS